MEEGQAPRIVRTAEDGATILFHDRLDRLQVSAIWPDLTSRLHQDRPKQVILDLSEVTGIDSAGVALIDYLKNFCPKAGIEFHLANTPEPIQKFLTYINKHAGGGVPQEPPPQMDAVTKTGQKVYARLLSAQGFVEFLGNFLAGGFWQLVHPSQIKLTELLYQIEIMGVGAIPLLIMLALLLGALMVFQGMKDIMNFGAPILIADMVGIAVTREMAPLVTGVVMAGRSGAGYAAEIGTMKLNEELDALKVHNFDITNYLMLPRIFALMVAGPLLTMIADSAGIIGGMITSKIVLQVPMMAFLNEVRTILGPREIYTGLIKGVVFGGAIGVIGCFRGLQTWTGVESLGIQTTSAVVTSIFVVIFLDTMFTYIIQMYLPS
jgi:phospholipid/cholesterol/gamma-HCH transport system permease protein